VRRDDGPDFICYTEAGIVGGKMGVNQHGIGLVENGLVSDHDGTNAREKPFHMRCREVLDAETFDKALLPIVETRRVCSANFVIGHADGEIINLETSPDAVSYHYPADGIVTHSNHFLDARHGPSQMERLSPSTLYRANRLDRLLRKDMGRLDMPRFRAALSDHFGAPNAICRHPDARQPVARRTMTNAAVVIDLAARTMHVANGPPCCNEFVAIGLEPDQG
jgi:isopenicillin-N N-acyltransferase-like protein